MGASNVSLIRCGLLLAKFFKVIFSASSIDSDLFWLALHAIIGFSINCLRWSDRTIRTFLPGVQDMLSPDALCSMPILESNLTIITYVGLRFDFSNALMFP